MPASLAAPIRGLRITWRCLVIPWHHLHRVFRLGLRGIHTHVSTSFFVSIVFVFSPPSLEINNNKNNKNNKQPQPLLLSLGCVLMQPNLCHLCQRRTMSHEPEDLQCHVQHRWHTSTSWVCFALAPLHTGFSSYQILHFV